MDVIVKLQDSLNQNFSEVFSEKFREDFFKALVGSGSAFQDILTLAMSLYVAITAAMFILGATNLTQSDLLMRILKIGFIYTMVSPNSWQWFSWFIDCLLYTSDAADES